MAQHFYKVGDNVMVWNQTMSGRNFCEGRATVVGLCDHEDTYMVRFDSAQLGDEGPYERRVPVDAADLPADDPGSAPLSAPAISTGAAFAAEIPPA